MVGYGKSEMCVGQAGDSSKSCCNREFKICRAGQQVRMSGKVSVLLVLKQNCLAFVCFPYKANVLTDLCSFLLWQTCVPALVTFLLCFAGIKHTVEGAAAFKIEEEK